MRLLLWWRRRQRRRFEATTCPRQAHATLTSQIEHQTVWETDRWGWIWRFRDWQANVPTRVGDALRRRGWKTEYPTSKRYGGTFWPAGFDTPRACSYCGGAHPDDVVRLLLAGWEVEPTDKSYKKYLHPPGYEASMLETRESGFKKWNGPRSPVPPVKVYVYHFNQRQVDAFNAALDQQKVSRVS